MELQCAGRQRGQAVGFTACLDKRDHPAHPADQPAVPTLTKLAAGRYRHTNGSIIEKRPRKRIGRNGYVLAGWAIVVDGREVSRWSSLGVAAEKADD